MRLAFSRKNINHEKIDVYVFIFCQIGMYVCICTRKNIYRFQNCLISKMAKNQFLKYEKV